MPRRARADEVLKSIEEARRRLGWTLGLIDTMNGPDASTFAGYTGQSVLRRLRLCDRELTQASESMALLVQTETHEGVGAK